MMINQFQSYFDIIRFVRMTLHDFVFMINTIYVFAHLVITVPNVLSITLNLIIVINVLQVDNVSKVIQRM